MDADKAAAIAEECKGHADHAKDLITKMDTLLRNSPVFLPDDDRAAEILFNEAQTLRPIISRHVGIDLTRKCLEGAIELEKKTLSLARRVATTGWATEHIRLSAAAPPSAFVAKLTLQQQVGEKKNLQHLKQQRSFCSLIKGGIKGAQNSISKRTKGASIKLQKLAMMFDVRAKIQSGDADATIAAVAGAAAQPSHESDQEGEDRLDNNNDNNSSSEDYWEQGLGSGGLPENGSDDSEGSDHDHNTVPLSSKDVAFNSLTSRIHEAENMLSDLYEQQRQLRVDIDKEQLHHKPKTTTFAAFIFGSNGKTSAIKSDELTLSKTFMLALTRKWGSLPTTKKQTTMYQQHRKSVNKIIAGTEIEQNSEASMIVDGDDT